jgi:hypothetical protein
LRFVIALSSKDINRGNMDVEYDEIHVGKMEVGKKILGIWFCGLDVLMLLDSNKDIVFTLSLVFWGSTPRTSLMRWWGCRRWCGMMVKMVEYMMRAAFY